MGVLYDVKAHNGLGKALADVRQLDMEGAQKAAMNRALALNWKDIAAKLAHVYRS
jgi:hypothetical protein